MKEKRKGRLDKGGSGTSKPTEFIGFGAFANADPVPSNSAKLPSPSNTTDRSGASGGKSITKLSPVYTGSNESLQLVFSRISQKRDGTTKTKALQDLVILFSTATTGGESGGDSTILSKWEIRTHALPHWIWLYTNKLAYDLTAPASVRAVSLQVWQEAFRKVPKAVLAIAADEMWGMLFAAQADPLQEVRNEAQATVNLANQVWKEQQGTDASSDEGCSVPPWYEGLLAYSSRILGYGRPSVMYDALFTKKRNTGGASTETEEAAEYFNLLTGLVLDALCLFFQQDQGSSSGASSRKQKETTQPGIFGCMTSAVEGLRLRTYRLVSIVASSSNEAHRDLLPNSAINTLLQSLSSEKNANAWPSLLEAFLAVAVLAKKKGNDLPIAGWRKGLIKALRKACYGASLASWGPILLPLTSTLSSATHSSIQKTWTGHNELALELISAAWEGQHVTLGMTEAGRLAMVVAETAHFSLLRPMSTPTLVQREENDTMGTIVEGGSVESMKSNALAIAEIWLEVLENALTDQSLATGNARRAAWEPLLEHLAKQLQRYQDHSALVDSSTDHGGVESSSVKTAFVLIRDEFWSRVSWPCTHPEALAYFVSHLSSPATLPNERRHEISHAAQTCFQELLAPYQDSSASFPSIAMYHAIQALVDYDPAVMVSEKFVMNDLLQWIILHTTSQTSDYVDNDDDLVRADFRLLASSLRGVPEKASSYWSTVLKEAVAAKPMLRSLTLGIEVVLQDTASKKAPDWIKSSTLDEFAVRVFDQESPFAPNDQLYFCSVVLGLSDGLRETQLRPIVSRSVWDSWVQMYKNSTCGSEPKALAQILLRLTQYENLLDISTVETILIQSWLQEHNIISKAGNGEVEWKFRYTEVLESNMELASRVVDKASTEIKRQVEEKSVDDKDENFPSQWGLRACRLVEMCRVGLKNSLMPSFSLLGLDNAQVWTDRPSYMYGLVMALFTYIDDKSVRLSLLEHVENSVGLLVQILVHICEASTDLSVAATLSNGQDRCSVFIEEVGASGHETLLFEAVDHVVSLIVTCLTGGTSDSNASSSALQLTGVLCILLRYAFPQSVPTPLDPVPVPSEIREGDKLWYVTDPKSPSHVEPVSVAKAHYDAEAGYYFTIHFIRNGEKSERQTVVNRLRLVQEDSLLSPSATTHSRETAGASRLRDRIVGELLRPYYTSICDTIGLGDVLNALVARVAVGSARGIGSTHFEIFKLLSDEEKSLVLALKNKEVENARESLWKLALSFGFGRNSESRYGTFRVFPVEPLSSHERIADLYNSELGVGEQLDLDRAVLAWLVVSLPIVRVNQDNTPLVEKVILVMFSLAQSLLEGSKISGFTSDSMLGLKALSVARRSPAFFSMVETKLDLRTAERACLSVAIESFSTGNWNLDEDLNPGENPVWKSYSDFPRIIEDLSRVQGGRELLAECIVPPVAEDLVYALFSGVSRFYAFNLLDCLLGKGEVLRTEQDIVLDPSTSAHLKEWKEGMDSQGALELEEDVEIVSQWLPISMMREIETWQDETFEDLKESKMIGRLLAWISVLRLIETSAPKDFRSRPAFVSYLTRADVVPSVLNVSILFNETINSSKSVHNSPLHVWDTDTILENEENIGLSNLSSLVLFRTFETLPSLCRRWWEEDCPKVYMPRVQSLVERHIAPAILKREMSRMKEATKNYGDMNVSGSVMSREVTATYMQDDFTLTVLIRLPASFPLRSAEVDCSRTLGVPLSRFKRWSLQITLMLNNQGGTLQDALMLWKDNVDKEFDGVEPCPICYSVLHVKTHKLPSLECVTCHNRFHADCLTQWFKQSGKNQCVLCQQDWQGVRV